MEAELLAKLFVHNGGAPLFPALRSLTISLAEISMFPHLTSPHINTLGIVPSGITATYDIDTFAESIHTFLRHVPLLQHLHVECEKYSVIMTIPFEGLKFLRALRSFSVALYKLSVHFDKSTAPSH